MPPNNQANVVGNLEPQHLSQWKPMRNQQAIQRFAPGACLRFEPTHAGDEQLFARCEHFSKMHLIQRFKPSHHMFVREHVRRVEVGIESGREEIEGEDAISGPEIEGRFEGCGKADGEAIAGADSARWSDGFRASGMVYPSASTCALSTHQAVFCSPLLAPMLCIDGVSDAGTLCEQPRLRWCEIQ